MTMTKIDPKIARAFEAAGSDISDAIPKLYVSDLNVTVLMLSAMEKPFRCLGYMLLPRLTLSANAIEYFTLGCFLIGLARQAGSGPGCVRKVNLMKIAESNIDSMLIHVWNFENEPVCTYPERNAIELDTQLCPLSPLQNHGLEERELPVFGVIRDMVSGLPLEINYPKNGSTLYLSLPANGAIALGKTLISFSISLDAEFIQFEQGEQRDGVRRRSYEIECLMLSGLPRH